MRFQKLAANQIRINYNIYISENLNGPSLRKSRQISRIFHTMTGGSLHYSYQQIFGSLQAQTLSKNPLKFFRVGVGQNLVIERIRC